MQIIPQINTNTSIDIIYQNLHSWHIFIVTWVLLPGIGEHVPHAPTFLGAWELVGNVPKMSISSMGTLELFRSFTATILDVSSTYF